MNVPTVSRRRAPARPALAIAALTLALAYGAASPTANAQPTRVPGDIVRDCSLTDRLRISWRAGEDPRAVRQEVFSRTGSGAPADWHGWAAIDGPSVYTFDDMSLASREFRISLKDDDKRLYGWSAWQRPSCAPGAATAEATAARGSLPIVVTERIDESFFALDWTANPDAGFGTVDLHFHDRDGRKRLIAEGRRGRSWVDIRQTLCTSPCPTRRVTLPLGEVWLGTDETLFELEWIHDGARRSTWIVVDVARRVELVTGPRRAGDGSSVAATPGGSSAGASSAPLAARGECPGDGTTRVSWAALAGATKYNLFRRDPGGSVRLGSVPGDRTTMTLSVGKVDEDDEIQVDAALADGSRRYGTVAARGCAGGASARAVASVGVAGLPPPLAADPGGWTRHPWSHDFDLASDLERWHAPHRIGGRDPDDRHVGKQRRERTDGPLVDNRADFAKVAFVDTAAGHLVMRSVFDAREEWDSRGLQRGEARMPFLISYAAFDTLDRDGRRLDWVSRFPYRCAETSGATVSTPCDFLIDPSDRDWYIEVRASFAGATDAFKTWWAFWLYPRKDAYDGNVDTGMEVDVLEYVPWLARDGFHTALFRRRSDTLRPDGSAFTARDTDAFLRGANADYDACRRAESCAPIRLDEGFHTIGLAYSREGYAFYLDGYRYWRVDDPGWVTKTPRLGLQLTWEKDEGTVIDDRDGNGRLDYLDDGVGFAASDGVPDWRQPPNRSGLSYGPWGQGFATDALYDRECLVRVVSGPARDRFLGQYTFAVARTRYGIAASDLEIVEGSCSLARHATSHPPSEVRIDHVHVYTRERR